MYFGNECKRFVKSEYLSNMAYDIECEFCGGDDLSEATECPVCGFPTTNDTFCDECLNEAMSVLEREIRAFMRVNLTTAYAVLDLYADAGTTLYIKYMEEER